VQIAHDRRDLSSDWRSHILCQVRIFNHEAAQAKASDRLANDVDPFVVFVDFGNFQNIRVIQGLKKVYFLPDVGKKLWREIVLVVYLAKAQITWFYHYTVLQLVPWVNNSIEVSDRRPALGIWVGLEILLDLLKRKRVVFYLWEFALFFSYFECELFIEFLGSGDL
jgi:hypothetical protein